jgi:hypothetical protein
LLVLKRFKERTCSCACAACRTCCPYVIDLYRVTRLQQLAIHVQAMMACLIHVALGDWTAMTTDLDRMGFLKDKINRADLARDLEKEVTAVWPLAGSFGAESFLSDGSAQEGGLLAARVADGTVRPELGLGQGLSFGKLAKVSALHILLAASSPLAAVPQEARHTSALRRQVYLVICSPAANT